MTKPKNQVDYKVQLKPVNVVVVSETEGRDGSTTVAETLTLVCIWLLDSATVTLGLTLFAMIAGSSSCTLVSLKLT